MHEPTRERALGRATLSVALGVAGLVTGIGTGLSLLLVTLGAVPLAWVEEWAERRGEDLGRVLAAAAVAWVVTALCLALGDLQYFYTSSILRGRGLAAALEEVRQEAVWLASPVNRAAWISPLFVVQLGGTLASASAAALAFRVARERLRAAAAVLGLGAILAALIVELWYRAFTVGALVGGAGPPVPAPALGEVLGALGRSTVLGVLVGAVVAAGAVLCLGFADRVGERVARTLPRVGPAED